ncbi:MAG: hypothetical protein ABMA13_05130 [Chthoniobacteraceae bacterium]
MKAWRKAANNGDAKAALWLGAAYFDGRSLAKNLDEAMKWLRSAATRQNPAAAYLLELVLLNMNASE